jgi:hypothetical protein
VLIQRGQVIVGRPAVEVRDLMRLMKGAAHSVAGLAGVLEISHADAAKLAADLRAAGLVDVTEHHSGSYVVGRDENLPSGVPPELLVTTISGNALAKARIGKPMARSEAQKLCDGVLARAKRVNSSGEWLHWVVEVGLYGSFAAPGDGPVGDVDRAVRLEKRYDHDGYLRRNDDMIDADGARPQTIIDTLGYAEVKLLRHLRGRSPRVDLLQGGPRGSGLPPGVTPCRCTSSHRLADTTSPSARPSHRRPGIVIVARSKTPY